MSWLKHASSASEDVFDENADELNLQSKEWTSNMKKRIKDGFVDGIDAGQEASLQVGFNQGFREGAAQTVTVGRLKGIVSAIWCWCQMQHPENPVPVSVTELLQRVTQHEDQIMESIRNDLKNLPPSVSDISESMDDLEMDQDPGRCADGCNESKCCKRVEETDMDPLDQHHIRSGSTNSSSSTNEDLNLLVQQCVNLVSELGLPHQLKGCIEELRNFKSSVQK